MDRTGRGGNMNVPLTDGRLLRLLAESAGAKHVVEIGTSDGLFGHLVLPRPAQDGRQAHHLRDRQRPRGDRPPELRARRRRPRSSRLVMGDAHQEVTKLKDPIDVVFIDADKEGYSDYVKKPCPSFGRAASSCPTICGDRWPTPRSSSSSTSPDLETLFYMEGRDSGHSQEEVTTALGRGFINGEN
ncbi:MAG: hypothetical protein MZV70_05495 [Desulfobacterales bacterium]|nr:hypothetical protein [Desulfobacterales bacterium]